MAQTIADMKRWLQLDDIEIDAEKAVETPEGYLVVPATLARVGVLEYTNHDGSVRRELRSEESVFGDMDRLGVLPVTALHPRHNTGEPIPANSSNYRAVTVGHVLGGSQRRDGKFLRAKLVIQDAATVAAIKRRELPEVSMGYIPTREPRQGEHNGERYEMVQTAAQYNHVALVPSGRAGSSVRLHIDSATGDAFLGGWQTDGDNPAHAGSGARPIMHEIINGKKYEVGSEDHRAALAADAERRVKLEADARAKDEQIATLTAERDTLKGERDTLKLEVDALKSVDVNAQIRERASVLAQAAAAGVQVDDAMDNAAVRRAIVAKRCPKLELAADASDDYVRGVLAGLPAPATQSSTAGITTVHAPPPKVEGDSADGLSDARRKQIARLEGRKEN